MSLSFLKDSLLVSQLTGTSTIFRMSFRLAQRLPKDVFTPSCHRLKDILMTSLTCLPVSVKTS
ncbi:Uncharacterized protein APZ42_008244 [Daphnia magna]|uniref:Uncharacterized protein n=1 Tax=Daphnia magna TaxID=35525 RepID=A0A162D0U4_9CRUS|nr:Uncharacterized protein APZ42_008244 [Daphnia magna]